MLVEVTTSTATFGNKNLKDKLRNLFETFSKGQKFLKAKVTTTTINQESGQAPDNSESTTTNKKGEAVLLLLREKKKKKSSKNGTIKQENGA